ncbi:putative LuxR-family transcriptional regulator [Actinoplanes missouriensis 431]|uniref:Putative LuxR-family transcriptional regulator n=1 Tax=Actinoplanes missouriensis (strain ATCC 14538 / DSM 43046 / CBS 188.64 / JCM 3121 / NBRC 102363 / NCIMB 12654 / NRRL B-3342 / UNCC 431) TaxID=512565 RepID=I0H572_ACTM4|nr:putative LuxR-family transcriptional regulator [Actinoplanes missouriensis 431]
MEPETGDGCPAGRGAEQGWIRRALREAAGGTRVLVLHGEPGVGKSALITGAVAVARHEGFRTMETAGTPDAAVSALLAAAGQAPAELREPLERWLARERVPPGSAPPGPAVPGSATPQSAMPQSATPQSATPGSVALRLAVLAVVAALCRTGPLLIAVDDVPEQDPAVVGLLAFVVRRLRGERLLVMFTGRGPGVFEPVAGDATVHAVAPLSPVAAAGLLDGLPSVPVGPVRAAILRYGGGNPLGLTTLAGAAVNEGRRPDFRIEGSGLLARTFAPEFAGLPARTRTVLLFAAAAQDDAAASVLRAAGAGLADFRPAEDAGLVSVIAGRFTFRHPLAEAVCYFTAPMHERDTAHARLAALLPLDSPARDWHLAQLSTGAITAGALERAAGVATAAGRGLEAAALLQRAADAGASGVVVPRRAGEAGASGVVVPRRAAEAGASGVVVPRRTGDAGADGSATLRSAGGAAAREAARLYGRAAAEADRCGDLRWSHELWNRVTDLTDDPAVLAAALTGIGNRLMWQPAAPTVTLVEGLLAAGLDDRHLVRAMLAVAARAVFTDGDPAIVARLRNLVARATPIAAAPDPGGLPAEAADPGAPPAAGDTVDVHLALALAVADPAGWAAQHGPLRLSPLLQPLSGPAERVRLLSIAGAAWVSDDIEIAIDHYRRALAVVRADGSIGVHGTAVVATSEVLFDMGLFEEAATLLDAAEDTVGGDPAGPVRRAILAQRASSLIRRGDAGRARPLLAAAGDPGAAGNRFVRYLLLRASAQLAASEGDALTAYTNLVGVFQHDHYLLSQRSVIELAGLAIDAGTGEQALALLLAARERAGHPTARRRWSWDVAIDLLRLHTGDPSAESRLREALAAAGAQWPYEYAVTELRLAQALSAQRRRSEARPFLISALDVFVRIGAAREAALARERLRATGVRAQAAGAAAFETLTPQHQLIARLAAEGLSNRAIAQRFGLSPRTIGCYLYQIYPKLGIARRGQLRDVITPL